MLGSPHKLKPANAVSENTLFSQLQQGAKRHALAPPLFKEQHLVTFQGWNYVEPFEGTRAVDLHQPLPPYGRHLTVALRKTGVNLKDGQSFRTTKVSPQLPKKMARQLTPVSTAPSTPESTSGTPLRRPDNAPPPPPPPPSAYLLL